MRHVSLYIYRLGQRLLSCGQLRRHEKLNQIIYSDLSMKNRINTFLVLACLGSFASQMVRAADPVGPSVLAQVFEESRAQNAEAGTRMPPATPTLPSGRYPQYQMDNTIRQRVDDPDILVLLIAPKHPLLIRASTFIDGQPFLTARRKRVEKLFQSQDEVEQPKKVDETSEDQSGEVVQESDAEEALEETPDDDVSRTYRRTRNPQEIIKRYRDVLGEPVSLEEIEWLVEHRMSGPPLLLLQENFQKFRANQRPVFQILDRDRNGTLSPSEISQAVESFWECDLNRDDVVTYDEIGEVADDPRGKTYEANSGRILVMCATEESFEITEELQAAYADASIWQQLDQNNDGRVETGELSQVEPDFMLRVQFQSQQPEKSSLEIASFGMAYVPKDQSTHTNVLFESDMGNYTFSAAAISQSDQISLGAIVDGYPMLPVLDLNGDGRFTIRELRSLKSLLATFDRDQDGEIELQEVPATTRICFGNGPAVHFDLAQIRSSAKKITRPSGPDWFTRMDRNKDYDLSRKEFPGTDEQFAALDVDKDELVSSQEATNYEKQSQIEE